MGRAAFDEGRRARCENSAGLQKKEKKGDANIFAFEAAFSIPAD